MWLTHVIFGDVRYDLECTERVFKSGLIPNFFGWWALSTLDYYIGIGSEDSNVLVFSPHID